MKAILKSDKKSLSYSLANFITPEIKVLRKMHLNFRKIAQKSGAIIKKNIFKIKKTKPNSMTQWKSLEQYLRNTNQQKSKN